MEWGVTLGFMSNIPRYMSANADLANFEKEVSVITSKMHYNTGSHNKPSRGVELMHNCDNWLLMNFVPLQEKIWIVWGKWLKENPFTIAACLLQAEIKLKLCRFVDCL